MGVRWLALVLSLSKPQSVRRGMSVLMWLTEGLMCGCDATMVGLCSVLKQFRVQCMYLFSVTRGVICGGWEPAGCCEAVNVAHFALVGIQKGEVAVWRQQAQLLELANGLRDSTQISRGQYRR